VGIFHNTQAIMHKAYILKSCGLFLRPNTFLKINSLGDQYVFHGILAINYCLRSLEKIGEITMLKSIETLISIIKDIKSLYESFRGNIEKNKRRRLAQTLNLIYFRLNDCIVTGEQILSVLDSFSNDPTQLMQSKEYEINVDGILLKDLIDKQRENLLALYDCLCDFSEIIRVIDAEMENKLHQFIEAKGVGLNWLAYELKDGFITFDGLKKEDVIQLVKYSPSTHEEDKFNEDVEQSVEIEEEISGFLPWYSEASEISTRLKNNSGSSPK
jgi:hypothetical protein